MSRTLAFARLDWLTVKSFWTLKVLLLQMAVFCAVGVMTGSPMIIVMMLVMQGVIFSTMPFAVGEQNGIDALYLTLPVARRHVVAGRYVFALCLNVAAALLGAVFSLLSSMVARLPAKSIGFNTEGLPQMVVFGLVAAVVIMAAQMPFCFKLGYAKSKLLVYLPFVLFSAVILVFSQMSGTDALARAAHGAQAWVAEHMALTVLLALAALAALLAGSAALSYRFYRRREF